MQRSILLAAALLAAGFAGVATADHPQAEAGRSLSFDHKAGNEWWVEVVLGGADASAVRGVQARDDGGDWRALTLRSWGAWAGSFQIEPGHRVWFRTTFADGTTIMSCAFTHPGGVEECEGGGGGGGDGGAFAFAHEGGNEWWVEVDVDPRPQAAQAMDEGGAWRTLTYRDWGVWAASFHIEPGHEVRFRAQDAAGAWHESCWFSHPAGVARCEGGGGDDDPPADGFEATFSPKPGNEWWVETRVDANEPVAKVDARVVDGAWHALTKRSWGAWAASFRVPDGSLVEFRATSAEGDVDLSGTYRWPGATLVSPPPDDDEEEAWPREGSYLRFDTTDMDSSTPGGSDGADVTVVYRFVDGAWERACGGVDWSTYGGPGAEVERWHRHERGVAPPAPAPTDVAVGQEVRIEWIEGCSHNAMNATVTGSGEATVYRDGKPILVRTWTAEKDGLPNAASFTWEASTGILLGWSECGGSYTGCDSGRHEDSDAPMRGTPQEEPPGWANRQEAYAIYALNHTERDGDGDLMFYDLRVEQRREFGRWEMEIEGSVSFVGYGGNRTTRGYYDKTTSLPRTSPTDVARGEVVLVDYHTPSWPAEMDVVVRGQYPERTTKDGATFEARVWWADEPDDVDAAGHDRDAWWDVDTGLLLRWERFDDQARTHGRLTGTNAPLAAW